MARRLSAVPPIVPRWCIFDNTTSGAAIGNALDLLAMLHRDPGAPPPAEPGGRTAT